MALLDLMPPIVTVDDRPVSPTLVRAQELPGQLLSVIVELTAAEALSPGAAIGVTLPGGSLGALEAVEVNDHDTPAGVTCLVVGRPPAARLGSEAVSLCLRDTPRTGLLEALLSNVGLSAGEIEGSNPPHARLTLLSEPRGPVVLRLGLLGGCLALFGADVATFANPAKPGRAVPLPEGGTTFRRRRRTVPALTLIAPDPVEWGKVIRHQTEAGSAACRRVLRLPEAVTEDELVAAGESIQAVERSGRFEVSGGLALASIEPGTWVTTAGRWGRSW